MKRMRQGLNKMTCNGIFDCLRELCSITLVAREYHSTQWQPSEGKRAQEIMKGVGDAIGRYAGLNLAEGYILRVYSRARLFSGFPQLEKKCRIKFMSTRQMGRPKS